MLSLSPLQRALELLYQLGVSHAVDDFVRAMPESEPEAARRWLHEEQTKLGNGPRLRHQEH